MYDITPTLPAVIGGGGFDAMIALERPSLLVGRFTKFRKGRYPVGRDEGDLTGCTLCAYRAAAAYQKWLENVVVGQIVQQPGEPFPETVEDIEDDGSPGEWQKVAVLYLRDLNSGADYTFVSGSFGGRRAITSLAQQVVNMRRLRPDALPLVRLDAGSFRSKQYGEIACPVFTVTGWITPDGQPCQLPASSPPPEPPEPTERHPWNVSVDRVPDNSIEDLWERE